MATTSTQYFLGNTEIINSYMGDVSVLVNPFTTVLPFPTGSLIGYYDAKNVESYPGSGSIWYDISGNSNHLTITASFTGSITSSEFPIFNSVEKSMEFNTNNGLITEPISSSVTQTFNLTEVAWIKLANISASALGVMAVQSPLIVGDGQGYFNGIQYAESASYRWEISSEDNAREVYSNVDETEQNQWIMVAATIESFGGLPENNVFKLYRNGNNVLGSGSGLIPNWFNNTGSIVVGAQYYNSAAPFGVQFFGDFSGSISTALVYNRALSGDEIQQLYEYGR